MDYGSGTMWGWCWGKSNEQVRPGRMEKTGDKLINARTTITTQKDRVVGTEQGKRRHNNRFVDHFSKSLMAQSIYF